MRNDEILLRAPIQANTIGAAIMERDESVRVIFANNRPDDVYSIGS